MIAEFLEVELPCPESMIGSMAVIPLPDSFPTLAPGQLIPPIQEKLFHEYAIEVPIIPWQSNPQQPQQLVRISAQLYNTPEQYQYLATALQNLCPKA